MKKKQKILVVTIIVMISISMTTSGQNFNSIDTSFYSAILDETKSMRVYLPPGYDDDTSSYPIVYYLHGATGSYAQVSEYLPALQNMIDTGYIHPMLVVGLDGQCDPFAGSMYTNSVLYGNYEDYIMQEAIPFAESVLRTKNSPDYRCIMGFAMGGYGSMKLAIKHTELFAGVSAYHGPLQLDTLFVLWLPEVLYENSGPPYNYQYGAGIFTDLLFTGAGGLSPNLSILPYQVEYIYDSMGVVVDSVTAKWKEHDCSGIVKTLDPNSYYPGLFFGCGIYDFLYFYPTNTCFADTLDDLGLDYKFFTTNDNHILSDEMLLAGMHFLDSVMHDGIGMGNNEIEIEKPLTLNVFPNPARRELNIAVEGFTIDEVRIYTLAGQEVMHKRSVNGIIDVSSLQSGLYIVEVTVENIRIGQKLVVE